MAESPDDDANARADADANADVADAIFSPLMTHSALTPLLAEPPVFLSAQPAAAPLGLSKHASPPPAATFAPIAPTFLST